MTLTLACINKELVKIFRERNDSVDSAFFFLRRIMLRRLLDRNIGSTGSFDTYMKDGRMNRDSGQIWGEIMQDFKIDWEKRGGGGKSSIIVPRFMNSNTKCQKNRSKIKCRKEDKKKILWQMEITRPRKYKD